MAHAPQHFSFSWRAGAVLLLALVVLVHGPALAAYFEADDFLWLIHARWMDGWRAITGNWGLGIAYRPLTRLSFLIDARLFGWNAAPWHAENLLLHAANALLLAGVVRRCHGRALDSVLVAGLFAVMPVDWENVDWISGRTGLLCLGFMLAAASFWQDFLRTGVRLWAACLCQAGALFCYEPAAMLAPALLAVSPWLGVARGDRRLARGIAALAATVAAVWALRWILLGTAAIATDIASRDVMFNLGFNFVRLGAHLWRDFGPAAMIATTALIAAGLAAARTRLKVGCLLACCLVLYLPFMPVAGFTERFVYLASVPLACAIGVSAVAVPAGRAALCALIVLFGLKSHGQAAGFRHAGDVTRALLGRIAAIPDDGRNLVFEGIPTHDGPYYLFWANFEDAVAGRGPRRGFAATSASVLSTPDLRRRALIEATIFLDYDPVTGALLPMARGAWLARNGLADSPCASGPPSICGGRPDRRLP